MKETPQQHSYLVTGGAGFIGSNLVRHLVESGQRVLNYDRLTYAANSGSLRDISGSDLYRFVQGDIADSQAVRAAIRDFQPDRILHLAAESHVDRSIMGPLEFVRTNVLGTAVLLEEALGYWRKLKQPARDSFRFIHISTDEVYGSLGEGGRFSERSPYDPHSPYSASKAGSDHLARAWHDTYGLPVIVTNCSNNYGPFQLPEKLIPMIITRALRSEPIPIYGSGDNVRDWIHVEDHCHALLAVATKGTPGKTYNIGADNEWRNIDLAKLICSLLDNLHPMDSRHADKIIFVADRQGHDYRYAIDSGKLRCELNWEPKWLPSRGFEHTVKWYLDNEAWWERALGTTQSKAPPETKG